MNELLIGPQDENSAPESTLMMGPVSWHHAQWQIVAQLQKSRSGSSLKSESETYAHRFAALCPTLSLTFRLRISVCAQPQI